MDHLIERAAKDLIRSNYAIALTGAGVSTESGIKDFRGPDGLWTKNPRAELEAYESYQKLLQDPKRHWESILEPNSFVSLFEEIAKSIPNRGHHALAEMEKAGTLKMVITQNVDGLHQKAGSQNVVEYHGGMTKLRCMSCGSRFSKSEFDLERMKREDQLPPRCSKCSGVLKGDAVYFGEPIPSDVVEVSMEAAMGCDLMLICGTSAVVYPFAHLPRIAKGRGSGREGRTHRRTNTAESGSTVTIIEINADATPLTREGVSDYLIQGKTGEILPKIAELVRKQKL